MTPENSISNCIKGVGQANGNARAEVDALYTPLDEALVLLHERQADDKLRKTVTDFHRVCPPTFLRAEPCAIFVRHIITPNRELEYFVSTVERIGLPPLCLEHAEDLFSTQNLDKYRLCQPRFEVRPNQVRGLRMMEGRGLEGRRLSDLKLANGTTLLLFHHALLLKAFPEFNQYLHDYSLWFSAAGREEFYYLHYLALFIRDGILFENFLADDREELRFTRERVLPSFAKAAEMFGVKPLIVPLLPRETECDDRWRCHDGALYEPARQLLRRPQ